MCIRDSLDTLKGSGPPELTAVVERLACRMVLLAGQETDATVAGRRVSDALSSGRALEKFARMIECQGGNPRVVEDYSLLPSTAERETFRAPRDGYLAALKAEGIGRASNVLGAGRTRVGDAIDHGVGIIVLAKPGDAVTKGQPLLELHHRHGRGVESALDLCRAAVAIEDIPPPHKDKVLGEVR